MRDDWLSLIDRVLRPARPDLARCLGERELHLERRRIATEQRQREIAGCEARINDLRATVFSANDGVVSSRMTALEREWRTLSRRDPDAGLMDLWARVAPAAWIDRKRFRDSEPADRVDAAIALASDVAGVEAAEGAIASLREALAAWGTTLGARVRWRMGEPAHESATDLLAEVLGASREALAVRGLEAVVLERAEALEREIREAACARWPQRPTLAADLAHAALVDHAQRAADLGRPNPVTPLSELWRAGYVLGEVDDDAVTIAIPPL